jgi:hypothetical protein
VLLGVAEISKELEMVATRKAPSKPRAPDKKGSGPKSSADTSELLPDPDLLTVTIHAKTGQIVKIERVNGPDVHHELTAEEKASLAKESGRATLEAIIEEAFEAGMAYVLEDGGDEDDLMESEKDLMESEKDANLRHLLLRPLIENSAAKRLIRRDVLSRAILKTLIDQAPGSSPGARG